MTQFTPRDNRSQIIENTIARSGRFTMLKKRKNKKFTHTNARLLRFQVSAFLLESTALLEAATNEKTNILTESLQ